MSNLKYHSALPENDRSYATRADGFTEFNTCDFVLNADADRALVLGSVRIEFDFVSNKTGATPLLPNVNNPQNAADRVTIDNMAGAHCLLESISTTLSMGGGQIENIDSYPRLVKMINTASSNADDHHRSDALCEMRTPHLRHNQYLLRDRNTNTTDSTLVIFPDVSLQPYICLNRKLSGDSIDFSKSGSIRLSMNFARNVAVYFGADAGTAGFAPNYVLKNLRCSYKTIPARGESVVMNRVLSMNQLLESTSASINTSVPAVVNAVSASFLEQSKENTYSSNGLELHRPLNINNIQMNYNDSSNAYQTFRLDNQAELVHNGIESFRSAGINNASPQNLDANNAFMTGIDFAENIDFSRGNKFSMTVESGIDSLNPVVLFLYFHSLVSI
jgi:hypothetical protein